MEDTEWTDALKKYGIIKEEPKIVPDEEIIVEEQPNNKKIDPNEDDLDDLDEEFLRSYRNKRVMEMKLESNKKIFGEVFEITAANYLQEVNQAGDGIWVVLLLYRQGHQLCHQLQEIFKELAKKNLETKFLKSIASTCMPNFPDDNLPAVLVYQNGKMIKQLIGPIIFGINSITNEVEWIIAKTGAIKTTLEEDPRKQMIASRKFYQKFNEDSEDSD
ncbi:Phosducin-like protein 3 [Sarcoptes scabiei]|nr:Phosducin-like protein 3 [Sarcoptes scabiei]